MKTLKNAPRSMERPLSAPVRLVLTEAQAAKAGLGDRYSAILARRMQRACKRTSAESELRSLIEALLSFAETNEMSRRELLKAAGVSWGTWMRCQRGAADALTWLPKLQGAWPKVRNAAASRSHPSP